MAKNKDEATTAVAEIPKSETTEVAAAPSFTDQFAEYAGAGAENVTIDAMAVPYLSLMQAKTPLVETDPENYKAGMLYHSITGKAYDIREKGGKPLEFLLCHFQKQIVEWGDKDAGNGGLKGRHVCDAPSLAALEKLPRNEKNKILAPNGTGNTLEETAYQFMLLMPGEDVLDAGVLPLKSTGLTPSKKLMRQLDSRPMKSRPEGKPFKLPLFATVCTIESFLDQQKSGARNYFQNVRFALKGELTDEMALFAAMAFYKSIQGGAAVLDDKHEEGSASAEHSGAGSDQGGDDNVPF